MQAARFVGPDDVQLFELFDERRGWDHDVRFSAWVFRLPVAFDALVTNSPHIMEKFLRHYEQDGDRRPRVRPPDGDGVLEQF